MSQIITSKEPSTFNKLPPGPNQKLAIKNLLAIRRDPFAFALECYLKYGDIVYLNLGVRGLYIVNHPDLIRHVLLDNNKNYSKGPDYERFKPILGNGILSSHGETWRKQRKLMQPVFHHEKLNTLSKTIISTVLETAENWENLAKTKGTLDVTSEMTSLTLKVATRTLFSSELNEEIQEISHAMTSILPLLNRRITSPLPPMDWLPSRNNFKFNKHVKKLNEIVNGIIVTRRKNPDQYDDLLSILIQAKDEETGTSISDQELRDEIMTFLIAGHETTANALSWAWYFLSKHPHIAKQMRSELNSVLNGKAPTFQDLPKLQYTSMVFQESMRLYPPVFLLSRQALQDDKIGGYPIPAGANVIVIPYIVHRIPSIWKNPEGFDPERFLPEQSLHRHKFVYLPFGAGARQCMGNHFAIMEAKIALGILAQRFELELNPNDHIEPELSITVRIKNGLQMKISKLNE